MSTPTSQVNFNSPADPPPPVPQDTTSLAPGNYTKTIILNQIFTLVLKMLTSLQKLAAAQANRLTVLTEWQKAYTDLESQIHTFSKDDGTFAGGGSSSAINTRSDLNRLNASYTQTMQNRSSVISDDAKALQSNVNQSNDAVTQQSNIGTSILTELTTILGALYH